MKCQSCGAELPNDAKFCFQCGAKQPEKMFCINCGAELPKEAKFCFQCGAKVGDVLEEQKAENQEDAGMVWESKKTTEKAEVDIYESGRNYGCGNVDRSTFGLFMNSGSNLYFSFEPYSNKSIYSNAVGDGYTELMEYENGQLNRYRVSTEVDSRATVAEGKLYYPDMRSSDIKCFDFKEKKLSTVMHVTPRECFSNYEIETVVRGINNLFYYTVLGLFNGTVYHYFACDDKKLLLGYSDDGSYPSGKPEVIGEEVKPSELVIVAYNRRYIYLRGGSKFFRYDIKTGAIDNLYDLMDEKYREKEIIGIYAERSDMVLLAKNDTIWGYHRQSIQQGFVTVDLQTGEEIDWHTESFEEKENGGNCVAFTGDSVVFGGDKQKEDAGAVVSAIEYDQFHLEKNRWVFDNYSDENVSGVLCCAGEHILRLWNANPITGEKINTPFYGLLGFSKDGKASMKPVCAFGCSRFTNDELPKMQELFLKG